MEDSDILGVEDIFLLYTLLRVLRQGISSSVSFALTIIDLKVVTREFLGLTNLFGAQTLYVHESMKVVMVCKDEDFVFATF